MVKNVFKLIIKISLNFSTILVLSTIFGFNLHPANAYSISGIVRYSTTPMENIIVELLESDWDGNIIETTYTNTLGEYRFDNVPDGEYYLKVYGPTDEYSLWIGRYITVSGEDITRDFRLSKKIILSTPENNSIVTTKRPTLTWIPQDDAFEYIISIWLEPTGEEGTREKVVSNESTNKENSYSLPFDLVEGETYQWRVSARDNYGELIGRTTNSFLFHRHC